MRRSTRIGIGAVVAMATAASAAIAALGPYGEWSPAAPVEGTALGSETQEPSFNGAVNDGCPNISRDGKTFFMASARSTGAGDDILDLNIWVSTRAKAGDAWGAPTLVGAPVSIDTRVAGTPMIQDFCPTLARNGHDFYFVSNRDGFCGTTRNADMYSTRFGAKGSLGPAEHLGCDVNTAFDEASPFPLPQDGDGPVLYFSSASTGAGDLYYSEWAGGSFQGRALVPGVNTAAVEGQPSVRRDGLEIFFFSNRDHATRGTGNDIFSATRATTAVGWDTPKNLGAAVNGVANTSETRPSLSWDGTTLYFGSTRTGGGDHYVSTRSRE